MTKKLNDSLVQKGKPGDYIQDFVNVHPDAFVIKNPLLDFSGMSMRKGSKFYPHAKLFHLKKEDFLTDKYPFDFNPFPANGVYILTDKEGRILYSVHGRPDEDKTPKDDNCGTPDDYLNELPF